MTVVCKISVAMVLAMTWAVADAHVVPAATPEECKWTSPTGYHYDLSALSKDRVFQYPPPRIAERFPGGFQYTMSVCSHPKHVIPACERQAQHHPNSPAFQLAGGVCYTLGDLHKAEWRQISHHNHNLGVELVYKDGQRCGDGRPREIRYHFICSPHFAADEHPLLVHETRERCHYNVTWPTKHGCPTYELTSPSTWSLGSILWYVAMILILYCTIGCCMNVMREEVPVGWDAMPHRDFWEHRVARRCLPDRWLGTVGLTASTGDVRFERFPMKAEERP